MSSNCIKKREITRKINCSGSVLTDSLLLFNMQDVSILGCQEENKKSYCKRIPISFRYRNFKRQFFIPSSSPKPLFGLNLIQRKSTWFRNVLSHFHKICSNEMSFSVAVSIKKRGEETENTLLVLLHLLGLRLPVLYFQKLINRPL